MRLKTVLCPIDFTSLSDREVHLGVAICQRFGAEVVLHHSLGAHPPGALGVSWMWSEDHQEEEQREVSDAYLRFQRLLGEIPEPVQRVGKLSHGPIEPALLHLARDLPADLIVMGSHGWSSASHRSITEKVLTQSPCPVLTIRDESRIRDEIFGEDDTNWFAALVPVDLSDHSLIGFDFALELLSEIPVRLAVVHVEETAGTTGPECRERLNDRVPSSMRDRFELHVVAGDTAEQVTSLAESLDAGLIVMGCHRKGFIDRLFHGSNACRILHEASCPVWFVPETARSAVETVPNEVAVGAS